MVLSGVQRAKVTAFLAACVMLPSPLLLSTVRGIAWPMICEWTSLLLVYAFLAVIFPVRHTDGLQLGALSQAGVHQSLVYFWLLRTRNKPRVRFAQRRLSAF